MNVWGQKNTPLNIIYENNKTIFSNTVYVHDQKVEEMQKKIKIVDGRGNETICNAIS